MAQKLWFHAHIKRLSVTRKKVRSLYFLYIFPVTTPVQVYMLALGLMEIPDAYLLTWYQSPRVYIRDGKKIGRCNSSSLDWFIRLPLDFSVDLLVSLSLQSRTSSCCRLLLHRSRFLSRSECFPSPKLKAIVFVRPVSASTSHPPLVTTHLVVEHWTCF
jgi:hypothetical protein